MDIQNLVPVDFSNQRVLLSSQVAQVFGTTTDVVKENFRRSKEHFEEGVHYFKVSGAELRVLKSKVRSSDPTRTPLIGKFASCLYLWTEQGTMLHCKMLNSNDTWEILQQLKAVYFNTAPLPTIVEIEGVRGYLDKDNIVWLNAADVARELGFVQENEASQKFPRSGENFIRWERVNSYLADFEFPPVDKDSFIPESEFYLLAMKAKNEKAKKFQWKVASKILPSIRQHGFYSDKPVQGTLFNEEVKAKKKRRPLPEYAVVYSALLDNALVKIGLTTDFNRRIKEVRKETGLDVEEVFTTGNLPLDDARKLESTVKAKFHDKNQGGELYDVPFEQVKTTIRDAPNDAFDKLLALADRLPDSEEKTRLVLQAASLI